MRTILLITITSFVLAFSGAAVADSGSSGQDSIQDDHMDQMAQARRIIRDSIVELRAHPYLLLGTLDGNGTLSTNGTINGPHDNILPLLENDTMDAAAQALCSSAISGAVDSMDANVTMSVLKAYGYIPKNLHVESSGVIMGEYIDPLKGANLLLKNLTHSIMKGLSEENMPALLENEYIEMGAGYCGGVSRLKDTQEANVYMLVLILARPEGPEPNWIQCGHVYFDINNNHAYDIGEGLENVLMTDDNGTVLAKTLQDGQYCFRRPKGEWTLYIESYPFAQNYTVYSVLLSQRENGVLWQDYPLLLTQGNIDANREAEVCNDE